MRRAFESLNTLVLNTLGIRRGTTLSKYNQIYFAFLFSALLHHSGSLNIPYVSSVPYQFLFFIVQPVCITMEDTVIALGRRYGFRDTGLTRALGYVWTFTALSFTTRYMAVNFTESGAMLAPNPVLFEVWGRVLPLLGIDGGRIVDRKLE